MGTPKVQHRKAGFQSGWRGCFWEKMPFGTLIARKELTLGFKATGNGPALLLGLKAAGDLS